MAVLRDFIHRWSWDDLEISHPSKEQIYRYLTLETDLDGVVSKMMELFMSLQPEIVAEMVYRRSAEFGRNKHTLQLKSPGFQFWNSPIRLANFCLAQATFYTINTFVSYGSATFDQHFGKMWMWLLLFSLTSGVSAKSATNGSCLLQQRANRSLTEGRGIKSGDWWVWCMILSGWKRQ